MRKWLSVLLSVVAAAIVSGYLARAAFIPLITGSNATNCNESSQTVACLNQQVISNINNYVGLQSAQVGPLGTTATTAEQTMASAVIPAGLLSTSGQSVRARCSGVSAANFDNKTITAYWGTYKYANTISGSSANWDVELLATIVTNAAVVIGRGSSANAGGAGIAFAPGVTMDAAASDVPTANNITVKCTSISNQANASTGDLTLYDLVVDLVK